MNMPHDTDMPVRTVRRRLLRKVWPISLTRSNIVVVYFAVNDSDYPVCGRSHAGVVRHNHYRHTLGIKAAAHLHHRVQVAQALGPRGAGGQLLHRQQPGVPKNGGQSGLHQGVEGPLGPLGGGTAGDGRLHQAK